MIPLDSPRWSELRHAYGSAANVPDLLRRLDVRAPSAGETEPWSSIWGALAHQGDVYSATFAAVPHVVAALERDPSHADVSFLHFPAWVEIARIQQKVAIPIDAREFYLEAIKKLPLLAAQSVEGSSDEARIRVASAAIAAARGFADLAEAILELAPDVVTEFMEDRYG